jgi:hypothetical protein
VERIEEALEVVRGLFIVYWQLRLPPRLPVAFATPVPREPATRVASP